MATVGLVDKQDTISIITANIGCGAQKGTGNRATCKIALRRLVKREKPSIVFIQESNFTDIARKYSFPQKYVSATKGGEDRFLFDGTELRLKMIDSGDISKFRNKKFKEFASYLETGNINMALVFTSKDPKSDPDILCVSWHGPHIRKGLTLVKKMEILEVMLRFVKSFSKMYGVPFIIGGDFNIEIAGVLKKAHNDIEVYDYDAGRRSNRVDFFISSKSLTLLDVKIAPWKDKKSDRVLDHDAVMGKLLMNFSKDFLKSTKDEPNNTKSGKEDYLQDLDIQEEPRIKTEDTAILKEESEKKLIKTDIAKEIMEELEEKINKSIEKYSKESSEETKKKLKKEIQEEFEEKMEEFKNK